MLGYRETMKAPTGPLSSASMRLPPQGEEALWRELRQFPGVLVAFSGGVDSSFLLAAALDALGPDRVRAVMGVSASVPKVQKEQAAGVAAVLGIAVEYIATHETENAAYQANEGDRCFWCKDTLYTVLRGIELGSGWQIVDGTNVDDLAGHRPGHAAAVALGVRSPLVDADLKKVEIRALSRSRQLVTADLPSSPCLASRFPAGTRVTVEGLHRIEAAEEVLRSFGFRGFRVRDHGEIARLEMQADDIATLAAPGTRTRVSSALRALGYRWVGVDLDGYQHGSGSLPASVDV